MEAQLLTEPREHQGRWERPEGCLALPCAHLISLLPNVCFSPHYSLLRLGSEWRADISSFNHVDAGWRRRFHSPQNLPSPPAGNHSTTTYLAGVWGGVEDYLPTCLRCGWFAPWHWAGIISVLLDALLATCLRKTGFSQSMFLVQASWLF